MDYSGSLGMSYGNWKFCPECDNDFFLVINISYAFSGHVVSYDCKCIICGELDEVAIPFHNVKIIEECNEFILGVFQ